MSEVAGRMSVQAAAYYLEKTHGGRGVLIGGVSGVEGAKVVVIDGGVVGTNALRIALGKEAQVTVLDKNLKRLDELDTIFRPARRTRYATIDSIAEHMATSDIVIGAVLVPGAAAPKLVTREMVGTMKPGAVMVDVAIDQGGCFETSHATTHTDPIYVVDGVTHYMRRQYAGRRSAHIDHRAQQRNTAAHLDAGLKRLQTSPRR